MHSKHYLGIEPENSLQKMWRYLSYSRLIDLLQTEELYFAHLSQMKDKWEGMLTVRTKEKLYKHDLYQYKNAETARDSVNSIEKFKEYFFVNCWHMNDAESYLMWKAYADKGCAIQTNYERIIASVAENPIVIESSVIRYMDYDREEFFQR